MVVCRLLVVILAVVWLGRAPWSLADEPKLDFARDVQPILARHCYPCHGQDIQEANLRLDQRESALKGGDSGVILIAGKGSESLIVERITADDESIRMPQKAAPLSAEKIAILKRWIDEGADWPQSAGGDPRLKHWSFQRPKRPALPEIKSLALARNPIDRFVIARLEKEGLSPSAEADKQTLARRLFLDLIGLPPLPEDVDSFLADESPDAYERLVDRLLASPHYGERWARKWLDLARYADTNGYEKDRVRSMWPYRDWVIAAFNADMPFDQFTIEQIAGDMLPSATISQRIATGFHRNTMINEEGGVDNAEFRFASVVDRMQTTGAVWLGLTVGCCQCHTHKYDPITQREYYQLFAMLNNADEPEIVVPSETIAKQRAEIESQIAAIQRQMEAKLPSLEAEFAAWRADVAAKAKRWTVLSPTKLVSRKDATLAVLDDGSVLASGDIPNNDTYELELPLPEGMKEVTALRLEVLPHESLPNGGPGRAVFDSGAGPKGDFLLSEIEVAVVGGTGRQAASGTQAASGSQQGAQPIKLQNATQSYTQEGRSAALATDGILDTGWSIKGRIGEPHWAVFELAEPIAVPGGAKTIVVKLFQEYIHQMTIGRFRISVTGDPRPIVAHPAPADIESLLCRYRLPGGASGEKGQGEQVPPGKRDLLEKQLADYFLSVAPGTQELRKQIADLRAKMPQNPTTLVMRERLPQHARVTHIHQRGEFLKPRDPVKAAVPAVLHPLSKDQPTDRLALARWLVNPANPLVGRVVTNRAWQAFFGRGLVRTAEDFGTQGSPPTHRELLDWLAVEFAGEGSGFRVQGSDDGETERQRESHSLRPSVPPSLFPGAWEFKRLCRRIVASHTYRQSSRVTPELLSRDSYNELLARGPRHRVDAELVRDIVLTASGQLTRQIGGESVFPPLPDGVLSLTYGGFDWKTATGSQRYRRGLYTFAKRTNPYSTFLTFDAPSGETCVVRRERSNTPLQSLTLLNDTVFVEAARSLAEKAIRETPADADGRITWIYRRCLSREPTSDERKAVRSFVEQQEKRIAAGELNAAAICGTDPQQPPAGIDLREWAAWTTVARAVLNLDETITKE